ncbi:NAD(+) diphosphatase [Cnuibacter sp. UC19_7]|uniref:NAD(+) diphosphatase n=1 Tax=Cnuibacter sp. UC19_7 TaxID=3350166 RepID=UPI00366ED2E7
MSRDFQSLLPLSRQRVDRDHAARTDADRLRRLWADEASRVVVLRAGKALGAPGEAPAVALLTAGDLPDGVGDPLADDGSTLYLGVALEDAGPVPAGSPLWAVFLPDAAPDARAIDDAAEGMASADERWLDLRLTAADLDDLGAGVFTEALAMGNWHRTHTHCPRCGAPSRAEAGGWVRRCTVQGIELFPRTDAAVIVGVVDDDDRLLLGSNAMWENNRYSLLAGFVEPGESLEAAATREIGEESGVVIDDPEYVGSQPWPFPASLMVGFLARVAPGGAAAERPDGEEILDLRWFTREELADAHHGVLFPGRSSIARAIIERWYGGPLPEPGF